MLTDKRVVITGGTGSLGRVLTHRLLAGDLGRPRKIVILSRDEAKQHEMRLEYMHRRAATDDVIYQGLERLLDFRIGDVRDFHSMSAALRDADVVFNVAALKQVPTCEYFPSEAIATNVGGAENIVRAIRELRLPVQLVFGISTDKACKPVSVMGMTKALQERIFMRANLDCPNTRFVSVRYANVLASRGSVIPLFLEQIRNGGPVTITTQEMTRFLLSLDQAVDVVIAAVRDARPGEIYVPRVPAARVVDIAAALIGDRPIPTVLTGIRPGEKVHETLVSEEEIHRTIARGPYLVIAPLLPELRRPEHDQPPLEREYSSADHLLAPAAVAALLRVQGLLDGVAMAPDGELLR